MSEKFRNLDFNNVIEFYFFFNEKVIIDRFFNKLLFIIIIWLNKILSFFLY